MQGMHICVCVRLCRLSKRRLPLATAPWFSATRFPAAAQWVRLAAQLPKTAFGVLHASPFLKPIDRCAEHTLSEEGIRTVHYHGDMSSDARLESVELFSAASLDGPHSRPAARQEELDLDGAAPPARQNALVMVCTDLAARGLDFGCCVEHVVNFDFPRNAVDYLHRAGRTARAGRKGDITSLVNKREQLGAAAVEEMVKNGGSLQDGPVKRRPVAVRPVKPTASGRSPQRSPSWKTPETGGRSGARMGTPAAGGTRRGGGAAGAGRGGFRGGRGGGGGGRGGRPQSSRQ